MELLLRGAVDKVEPPAGDALVAATAADAASSGAATAAASASASSSEASGASPHVASTCSADETDSSSLGHRNSPVLHEGGGNGGGSSSSKKRPYSGSGGAPPGSIDAKMGGTDRENPTAAAVAASSSSSPFIPLHAAIECGSSLPVVLAVLDERPQDVKGVDNRGRTALHWAACHAFIRRQDARHAAAAAAAAAAEAAAAASTPSSSSSAPPKKKKKSKAGAATAAASNAEPDAPSASASASTSQVAASHLELVERVVTAEAARARDANNKLPLHLALESRASLPVVACLLRAHPRSGVLPCNIRQGREEPQEEAAASSTSTTAGVRFRPFHWACHHDCDLDVVFHLLRADPGVLEAR
jgi:hypothetical protein